MIKFLMKGLLRDRSRSLFPLLVIILTVSMVIFTMGFMRGMFNSFFLDTAVILTGHAKVVTRAYNEESQLLPNDLAILNSDSLVNGLNQKYPEFFRIFTDFRPFFRTNPGQYPRNSGQYPEKVS